MKIIITFLIVMANIGGICFAQMVSSGSTSSIGSGSSSAGNDPSMGGGSTIGNGSGGWPASYRNEDNANE